MDDMSSITTNDTTPTDDHNYHNHHHQNHGRRREHLDRLLQRLLNASRRPALAVISRKLAELEELVADIEDRRLAAHWTGRLADLLERFEELQQQQQRQQQTFNNGFSHQHQPKEGSSQQGEGGSNFGSVLFSLSSSSPSPPRAKKMTANFGGRGGSGGNGFYRFCEDEGAHSRCQSSSPLPSSNHHHHHHHTLSSSNNSNDYFKATESARIELQARLLAQLKAAPAIDDKVELISLHPKCHEALSALLGQLSSVLRTLELAGHRQEDRLLVVPLYEAALAKLPAARRAHFTEQCYASEEQQTLVNLWRYLNNWATIRAHFELSRAVGGGGGGKCETRDTEEKKVEGEEDGKENAKNSKKSSLENVNNIENSNENLSFINFGEGGGGGGRSANLFKFGSPTESSSAQAVSALVVDLNADQEDEEEDEEGVNAWI